MEKLVRDRLTKTIPSKQLRTVKNEAEFLFFAKQKLQEELNELIETDYTDPYEYADVIEVLYLIARLKNITSENLDTARNQKLVGYGAFKDGVVYNK